MFIKKVNNLYTTSRGDFALHNNNTLRTNSKSDYKKDISSSNSGDLKEIVGIYGASISGLKQNKIRAFILC